MRKLLIVLRHRFDLWNAPPWFAERVRHAFPQLEVVHLSDYDHLEDEIRDAEIVVAWSLRPQQLPFAKKLKWLHSTAAAQLVEGQPIAIEVVLFDREQNLVGRAPFL